MGRRGPPLDPHSERSRSRQDDLVKAKPLKFKDCKPEIPLSAEEQKFFDRIVKKLTELNIISDPDLMMITRYACMIQEYHVLRQFLLRDGATLETETARGIVKTIIRPEQKRLAELEVRMKDIEKEFAFTPGSRLGMKLPKKDDSDDDEDDLFGQ